jgi:hypothetical protein
VLPEYSCDAVRWMACNVRYKAQAQKNIWGGRVNRLMTTSEKKKTTQTSRGKKEAQVTDQIDEYNFFISGNGNGTEEVLRKDNKNKQSLENGIIKTKKSIDFFLPE